MQGPFRSLLVLIFGIVILGLLIMALKYALPTLGLGEPYNTIIMLVVAAIILIGIANWLGIFGSPWWPKPPGT